MPKPKKQGRLGNNVNTVVLMNDKCISHRVSPITVSIWNRCDGRTETADIVTDTLTTMNISKEKKEDIGYLIKEIITKLADFELVRFT